jgi:hypothetical protein
MLTAEARVETDRAGRYLVQLCRHAGEMGRHRHLRPGAHGGDVPPAVEHVDCSDGHGTIRLGGGRCTLRAGAGALELRVEAVDEEALRRGQDGIARRLETIGRRDGLKVTWHRCDAPGGEPGVATGTAAPSAPQAAPHGGPRRRAGLAGLVAVGVLAVAVHLGVLGAASASARWTGWAADAVLAVVALKVLLIGSHVVLGRSVIRRRRRRTP